MRQGDRKDNEENCSDEKIFFNSDIMTNSAINLTGYYWAVQERDAAIEGGNPTAPQKHRPNT